MSERVENLKVKCFMCQNIAAKVKENKVLTSSEEYHLTADLSAIEKLRKISFPGSKQEMK
ncbi:MAG: hypothetical protein AB1498_02850 [bacterium]